MSFLFLPQKIKEIIERASPNKMPFATLRSNKTPDGESGEAYLCGFDDRILLLWRKMGADEYQSSDISDLSRVRGVTLEKERFNHRLDIRTDESTLSVLVSSGYEKDAQDFVARFKDGAAPAKADAPAEQAEPATPPPIVHAGAAMLFVLGSDNELGEEEEACLKEFCFGNEDLLKAVEDYYQTHTYEDALKALAGVDKSKAVCVVANLMEAGMSDGTLRSAEQAMIKQAAMALGLTEDQHAEIRNLLVLKNRKADLL